jgi:hypothetical protein
MDQDVGPWDLNNDGRPDLVFLEDGRWQPRVVLGTGN